MLSLLKIQVKIAKTSALSFTARRISKSRFSDAAESWH